MNGNNLQRATGFQVRPALNASTSYSAESLATQLRQKGSGNSLRSQCVPAAIHSGMLHSANRTDANWCYPFPGDRSGIVPPGNTSLQTADSNVLVEVIKVLVGMLSQLIGLITARLSGGSGEAQGMTVPGSVTAVSGAGGQATTAASGTQKESGSWFDKIGEILGGIGDVFGGVKDLFGLGKEKSDAIESKKEAGGSSIWGDLLGIGAGMLLGRSGGLKKVGTAVSGVAKKAGSWIMESAGGLIKKGISWFSGLFA